MSGLCGLYNLDGAPANPRDLEWMTAMLQRRGPERTGVWSDGPAGLGHTLLATTPEAENELLPLEHAASGCVITGDARLDNRDELLAKLGIRERSDIGDAELILHAYLAWGEACVEHFLGDFAFAIVDPRAQRLFCARDQMGMRPVYYHHSPRRFVAFASEPDAILVLPQTPYRIDDGRIADYLVTQLEGIDKSSTFFEQVYRLPPAHTLTATATGVRLRRYWQLEPREELRLGSDREYAEAFIEVFTKAVESRLRSAGPVGSMLSGGMDSGSIVAVARRLLADAGRGPLSTFSAVAPDPATCIETRTIHAATRVSGLDPHMVSYDRLDDLGDLRRLSWTVDEPFDAIMTLPRAMYLAGRATGVKVMLDGAAGDTVLGEGDHLARLLRSGRWVTAYREAAGENRFYGDASHPLRRLHWQFRVAFVPEPLRRLRSAERADEEVARAIQDSAIAPDFARRVGLDERLARLRAHASDRRASFSAGQVSRIEHPYLVVGRERYDRVAAAVGIEARDPFVDLRLLALLVSLPAGQFLAGGWPKPILRRAMVGHLPAEVRFRRGKEHLGAAFTDALVTGDPVTLEDRLAATAATTAPYVDSSMDGGEPDPDRRALRYAVAQLAVWLDRYQYRPQPCGPRAGAPSARTGETT